MKKNLIIWPFVVFIALIVVFMINSTDDNESAAPSTTLTAQTKQQPQTQLRPVPLSFARPESEKEDPDFEFYPSAYQQLWNASLIGNVPDGGYVVTAIATSAVIRLGRTIKIKGVEVEQDSYTISDPKLAKHYPRVGDRMYIQGGMINRYMRE
ncbi:MAG: hypothetical protein JW816_04410 [Candidatus Buchananbacteria bacterium]|nr:hypothetical protein [Candidatus Buchananbacteria bacterium]